jgi:carbonic anhydrase
MSAIDELLANNQAFADSQPADGLGAEPTLHLAVVTCMDCRLDVYAMLGLRVGEAHILRNAGGVVTDDVLRSLTISQRRLGTRAVMLIHHTRCGMLTLTDDGFRAELLQETGMTPAFAIESFPHLEEDVRQSIHRVLHCPFLPHPLNVRGFIYDVDTGELREIFLDDEP